MPYSNLTKKALAESLKELMAQRPFAKISVGDICEKCSMNRKSFYYHFQDKYDLVNWIFYTEFIETLSLGSNAENLQAIDRLCRYFYDNRAFYINALEVSGQNCFTEYFASVIEPYLMDAFTKLFGKHSHRQFYIDFFTDAFLVSIKRWLTKSPEMPPEEYVELLRSAMQIIAQGVIQNIESFTSEGTEKNEA